ncbi:hypothetical protein GMI70_03765 [Eggerthellaceae bacterium zg-893]|nr:hypothetical protein [Eggerthellaceae bacterium zg-893]
MTQFHCIRRAGIMFLATLFAALSLAGCTPAGASEEGQVSATTHDAAAETPKAVTEEKEESLEDIQPGQYGDSRDELIAVLKKAQARAEKAGGGESAAAGESAGEDASETAYDTSDIEASLSQLIEDSGASASFAYRYLSDSGWDFSVHGKESHTAASMISLAVLTQLFDRIDAGDLSLDDEYELTEEAIVGGNGRLQDEDPGTAYSLRDLVWYSIVESDNTATNMLIDIAGMDAVNSEVARQGLEGTSLERHMMDTEAQKEGRENRMAADDAAAILNAIAQGAFYNEELSDFAYDLLSQQKSDSAVKGALPEGATYAFKSGSLENVYNEGGVVFGEHPYVFVAFVEGVDEEEATALVKDAAALVEGWTNP